MEFIPNRKVWVATDWHLWYSDKNHKQATNLDIDKILNSCKELIRPYDILIYLGDIAHRNFNDAHKIGEFFGQMPGYKVLCKGNHDVLGNETYLENGFDLVCDVAQLYNIVFSHIPLYVDDDMINIHGHLHTEILTSVPPNHINAYIGTIEHRPYELHELIQNAILTFNPDKSYIAEKMKFKEAFTDLYKNPYDDIINITELYENGPDGHPVDESVAIFKKIPLSTANQIASICISKLNTYIKPYKDSKFKPTFTGFADSKCIIIDLFGNENDQIDQYTRESHSNKLKELCKKLKYDQDLSNFKEIKDFDIGDGDEGCIYVKLKYPVKKSKKQPKINESVTDKKPVNEILFQSPWDTYYWERSDDEFDSLEDTNETSTFTDVKRTHNRIPKGGHRYFYHGENPNGNRDNMGLSESGTTKRNADNLPNMTAPDPMSKIAELNNELNSTPYGVSINRRPIDPNATDDDFNQYRHASPTQFEKQNGGVCWDYVTYEAAYFKKHFPDIKWKAWYVQFDNGRDCPSHTYLTFKYNGQHYYFESSFKRIAGIYVADNEKDILSFVLKSMSDYPSPPVSPGELLRKWKYYVFTYNPLDRKLYGSNATGFMNRVYDTGTQHRLKFDPKFKVTRYA